MTTVAPGPASRMAWASVAAVPAHSITMSAPCPPVAPATAAAASPGATTALAPQASARSRFHAARVTPTITRTPMARSSCTCSRPATPRPVTTALASGDTVTPDSACTQVDSTWIRAASSAVTSAGSGCSSVSGTATYSAKQPSRSRPSSPPRAHRCGRSLRHSRHRPQKAAGFTTTRVPAGTAPPGPGTSTHPVISCPSTRGAVTGNTPAASLRSVPQMPATPTRTSASPPAWGAGTSRTVTAPGRSMTAASMVQCSHPLKEAPVTSPTAAVGFVGLGTMGSALSAHLLAAGWQVAGYDIDAARLAAHTGRGGEAATSPAGTAIGDVVVTSLPTAQALLDVATGKAGLASLPRPGLVVIETS